MFYSPEAASDRVGVGGMPLFVPFSFANGTIEAVSRVRHCGNRPWLSPYLTYRSTIDVLGAVRDVAAAPAIGTSIACDCAFVDAFTLQWPGAPRLIDVS